MRHSRTLLFLAAITALLTAIVVFEPGREREAESVPLTPLATAELQRLRIERQGQAAIELERRGSHWWMTAPWPVAVAALDYRIESTLGLLSAPRGHSQPTAGLDLAQFELDAPTLLLEAGDERLAFGNAHPITRERHVLRGEELHRIADFHFAAVDVDAAEWVATAAIPPEVELARIELPGRVLALAPPAPGPDDTVDPAAAALAWSGPQGAGEMPAQAVANAWREARAWRVEPLKHWEKGEAGTHSAGDEGSPGEAGSESAAMDAAMVGAEAATSPHPGPGAVDLATGSPIIGAADVPTVGPITGAADVPGDAPVTGVMPSNEQIRIGWNEGGVTYRIVKREPELVLARDDVGLAWVFEGPDARLLLGLEHEGADGEPATDDAALTLPALPGEHLHAH